ncbi:MAG: MFS transporter [Legionella sp.]|nr:MFS transporter [Legionella sp.]
MSKRVLPYIVCIIAGLFYAFEMLQMSLGSTLSTVLIKNYGFTIHQLQLFSSIYLYSCALLIIPAGILFDRYQAKPLLLLSMIVCLIGLLLTVVAKTPFLLIMGRALIGLSSDFSFLGYFVLINHYFQDKRKIWMNSLVYSWGAVGCLVSQAPFNLLMNALGMSKALFILFVIGLFLLLGMIYFIEQFKPTTEENTQKLSVTNSLKKVLSNKINLICAFYSSITNLPLMVLGALYGKIYLIQALNLTPTQASHINSIIFLGALIGSPIIGHFASKFEIPKLMMITAFMAAACWTGLSYCGNSVVFVSFIFFGFGILINAQLLSILMVGKANSKKLLATSISVLSITNNLGGGMYQYFFSLLLLFYAPVGCISQTCVYSHTAFNQIFILIAFLYIVNGIGSYLFMSTFWKSQVRASQ